jgi:hypothetical protein
MKKFTSIVLALALALTVAAPVAASAQSAAFTSNLTIGSRGSDVVALQSFLVAKGFLTMPAGVAMGYFGGLTKSALAAYQSSKGITPAAGYFGPITRAAVGAEGGVAGGTTPGCSAGAMFNSVTGQPCAGQVTVPGCSAGALYNSQTGAACGGGSVLTPSNVEGSLDVRLASTPADNSNIRTQTDVPVYGLEFRARIADVAVQTLDLQFTETLSSSAENPATLINTIKVWDGSTLLATVPVSMATFTKDQNQVYYARISGLNFVVPKDATKVLTVTVSTNSIDSDRTLVIDGYNTSSVRAVSGNGVNSFYSIDGSGYTRTFTFKKPGTSTLTLSNPASTIRSQNWRVNGNDVLSGVTLGQFNLKSDTGASALLTVNASTSVGTASTTVSATLPTTLYLYNGSTLIDSKTVPSSGSVSFTNLDTKTGATVAQSDTPTTFTIKGDFPANTTSGTYASTTIQSVTYQTPAGNTATAGGSAVTNANQYVYLKAAVVKLASAPSISVTNQSVSGVGTTTMTAVFPLTIQALGGNVIQPGPADFTVIFSNGTSYTASSTAAGAAISVAVIPQNDIADGSTANVTVTASCNGTCATSNGLFNAALTVVKWNAGNGTTTQTYGLEDFKTSSAVQFTR